MMARPKCLICNNKRGKRKCRLYEDQLICPSCCVDLRNEDCKGCHHYETASRFKASKKDAKTSKEFIIEINEEVENAVNRALTLIEKGQFNDAQMRLHPLAKMHPGNHMVMYALGTACAFQGDFDNAIQYFEKAVAIFPYFVEAYFNLGNAYLKKYEIEKSVQCMREVIQIGGDAELVDKARDVIRFLEEGIMKTSHISLNEYLRAKEIFDTAFAHMEKGRWEKAIDEFTKCLEIDKDSVQCHGNMGICYGQLGERAKAMTSLGKALEIDPGYEPALVNIIQAEKMREGEPLPSKKMEILEYYQDYPLKNKRYLKSLLEKKGK